MNLWKALTICLFFGVGLFFVWVNATSGDVTFNISPAQEEVKEETTETVSLADTVLPSEGYELSVQWADLGKQMIETGVIDAELMESLYSRRGGLSEAEKALLYGEDNGSLTINEDNAGFILNLLWAFGLANQNAILEEGPMQNYGDAGRFASTGGWSLAVGDSMDHYSQYAFVILTDEQQKLVEEVSQNIYRPCCGNSTYFPDCNHGMAMLGLLELLASQGATEGEMYQQALQVNAYWFPSTYVNIAQYFKEKDVAWDDVDPKEALGENYSSASGYNRVLSEIQPTTTSGGGGCSV